MESASVKTMKKVAPCKTMSTRRNRHRLFSVLVRGSVDQIKFSVSLNVTYS